ncbi:MAG: dTMP kinase [Nitrospirae bacterium]|nr:dTMP kinase [Nitrospirota bacterium]
MLITFEGIEGSGKSTQLERLASRLRLDDLPVTTTREPGGTAMGEKIRDLLLDLRSTELRPKAELFLYLAGRSQHLETVVRPLLARGIIILCDRFTDATLAYQGYGRRLLSPVFRQAVEYAADRLQPDLTLLLDLDPRTALARVGGRGEANRMDRETLAFHTRVRRGYLELARRAPRRIALINARPSEEVVAERIEQLVRARLRRFSRGRRSTGARVATGVSPLGISR